MNVIDFERYVGEPNDDLEAIARSAEVTALGGVKDVSLRGSLALLGDHLMIISEAVQKGEELDAAARDIARIAGYLRSL